MVSDSLLVEIKNLTKLFPVTSGLFSRPTGYVHAVDDVSFDIPHGKTIGLVGESGCGKTTTGRTLLRLIPPTSGRVDFDGEQVFELDSSSLQKLRKRMQIIFQDPYASLNPRMTIGDIVGEGVLLHSKLSPEDRQQRVKELLEMVELPRSAVDRYPHEFSGGQRQRIGIARALSTEPDFIVCDEAVSALDVSIQAQIINLLQRLQQRLGIAYLFIAHDLAVVRHIADRVVVMYLGHVMENCETDELFEKPLHPYTRALLSAIPQPDPTAKRQRTILTGDVPSPLDPPPGCRFYSRCPKAMPACREGEIPTFEPHKDHLVRCLLFLSP